MSIAANKDEYIMDESIITNIINLRILAKSTRERCLHGGEESLCKKLDVLLADIYAIEFEATGNT